MYVTTFCFFSFEMKAGPVPMYWEGRGSICVKLGDQKSTAVFQPKISSKFWNGFETLPNRLRSVDIWRLKSVEWCNY